MLPENKRPFTHIRKYCKLFGDLPAHSAVIHHLKLPNWEIVFPMSALVSGDLSVCYFNCISSNCSLRTLTHSSTSELRDAIHFKAWKQPHLKALNMTKCVRSIRTQNDCTQFGMLTNQKICMEHVTTVRPPVNIWSATRRKAHWPSCGILLRYMPARSNERCRSQGSRQRWRANRSTAKRGKTHKSDMLAVWWWYW